MGNVTLNGATSGQITLAPTAVAGTNTLTLPAATGTVALTNTAVFNSATTLSLQTGGTTGLYIDASQNIGIGTSSPGAKLQVVGTTWFGSGSTGAIGVLTPDPTSGVNGVNLSASFASGGYGPLTFSTSATERMRLDSSGNLLVGTTSAGTYGQKQIIVGGFGVTIATTFALTSSVQKIAAGVGLLCVIRDTTFGGVCIALYENTLTPVIFSQTNSGKFITSGTPTGQQILLGNANQSPLNTAGIQASTASGAGISVSVATISCQNS